jgi:hypothetical protein
VDLLDSKSDPFLWEMGVESSSAELIELASGRNEIRTWDGTEIYFLRDWAKFTSTECVLRV